MTVTTGQGGERRLVVLLKRGQDSSLERLRELARRYGKRTVRRARDHVELIVLTHRPLDLLGELAREGYTILEARSVDDAPTPDLATALVDYAFFMWHERYWEAHEVLEGIWRQDKDPCLAGLINLAASLVKLQEGNLPSHVRIVKRAVRLLEHCRERDYVNGECIFGELERALKQGRHPRLHLCVRAPS